LFLNIKCMKIGLIGVGNMGTPLLRKLINNKYNASVLLENNNNSNYDCMTFKNNELNQFIKYNTKFISVLPNSNITYDLVSNINNKDSKIWMDLCSSSPKDVVKISDCLQRNNINYIDAPVSGGPKGMEKGILTSIISGPEKTYKDFLNIINLYSDKIFYVSDKVGTSSTIKLANNTLLALNLISSAEILNILDQNNVDLLSALNFINNSSGRNWATLQRYPDNILTGKYDYGFSYQLHKKDVLTFIDSVKPINNKFLLEKIENIYRDKKNDLGKNMDHTEIVKLIK